MSSWPAVRLDSVAAVFNGKTPAKSEQRSAGHPVFKVRNVDELGRFRGPLASYVDPDLAAKFAPKCVVAGDTLILNAAHNADYVSSKTFRAGSEAVGALATGEWLVVRPDGDRLHAAFVNHWVNFPETRHQLRELVNGIHLYPKDVARLLMPLPPLPEQRRIAAILDQAETLRTQRRAAIAEVESLAQAVFLEMFGDVVERGWQMATVGDVAQARQGSMRTGPFGSQLLHSEFVSQGVAVLGIDNAVANEFRWGERRFIAESKYRQLKRYTVNPGDVLITIMGTCGRCTVVPADIPLAINTKHLCCITLDQAKCLPEFLHAYFLRHPIARKYLDQTAKGAIMSGLNLGIIKAMPVPLAPMGLQQDFVDRIRAIEQLKATHRSALSLLDELFSSLQHRAFRGELTPPARASGPKDIGVLEAVVGLEALIFVAKRMPAGRHHHYKSLKALYFADKRHLEKHGRLIYGETHSALPHGPVPQAAYDATRVLNGERLISDFDDEALRAGLRRIKDDQQDKLVPLRDADFSKLGRAERESLEWAIRYCADMSFEQVKAASHDAAYGRTQPNKPIPLEYLADMLPAEARERHWAR